LFCSRSGVDFVLVTVLHFLFFPSLENPTTINAHCQTLKKNKSLSNMRVKPSQRSIVKQLRCKSTSSDGKNKKCKTVTKTKSTPDLEQNKSFHFSRRNFYPRQNQFNQEKRKFNPFDYYSNNYFPSKISPRKNQISLDYYNLDSSPKTPHILASPFMIKAISFNKFEEEKINFNFNESMTSNNYQGRNDDLSTKSTSPNSFEMGFIKRHNSENVGRKQSSTSSLTSLNLEENKTEFTKKSHFVERQGDWICTRCKNLNFSFRIVCNRCKISKAESEVLYEGHHMQNIYNLIKYNELIQNQILLAQQSAFNINSPAFYPARVDN